MISSYVFLSPHRKASLNFGVSERRGHSEPPILRFAGSPLTGKPLCAFKKTFAKKKVNTPEDLRWPTCDFAINIQTFSCSSTTFTHPANDAQGVLMFHKAVETLLNASYRSSVAERTPSTHTTLTPAN